MEPSLWIAACWLFFSGTHIGLATRRVRGTLAGRLGERGFTVIFSGVAAVSFSILVHVFARVRLEGAAGPALGSVAVAGPIFGLLAAFGIVLMIASFATYPSSPMAAGALSMRSPVGLERVTRHPFFAGVAIFGLAHVALAAHLVGVVFFGGLALHAILGTWHQDRKLLRRRGDGYRDFVAATSGMPFAALLAGRQSLVWRELPWIPMVLGVALAYGLRAVHASIFDLGGIYVIGALVGGAATALVSQWSAIPGRNSAPGRQPA